MASWISFGPYVTLILLLTTVAAPAEAAGSGGDQVAAAFISDTTRAAEYENGRSWFSRDKAYHFSVSAVGAGGVYAIGRGLGLSRVQSALASAVILGTAGIWREIGTTDRTDLITRRHISEKDLVWDGIGIAVGISVSDLLYELLFRSE